jgi:hypothetical protein
MNELLARIVRLIPSYLGNLLEVVRAPKRFIRERLSHPELPFENALAFLGISLVIGWLIKLSIDQKDPWMALLIGAGFILVVVLGYGAGLCIAWRAVGGRADVQKIFIIHFYYSGVLKLFTSCWFMTIMGIMKAESPEFYGNLMTSVKSGNLFFMFDPANQNAFLQARGLLWTVYGGMIALAVWCIAAWGAYRELNGLSAFRSAVAAIVFLILSIPVTAAVMAFAAFATSLGAD